MTGELQQNNLRTTIGQQIGRQEDIKRDNKGVRRRQQRTLLQ